MRITPLDVNFKLLPVYCFIITHIAYYILDSYLLFTENTSTAVSLLLAGLITPQDSIICSSSKGFDKDFTQITNLFPNNLSIISI